MIDPNDHIHPNAHVAYLARFSPELKGCLEQVAAERGVSQTAVILAALGDYLEQRSANQPTHAMNKKVLRVKPKRGRLDTIPSVL